jgi:hypothetical protein
VAGHASPSRRSQVAPLAALAERATWPFRLRRSRPAAAAIAARLPAPSAPLRASPDSSAPAAQQAATQTATVPGRKSPATAPTHVLQPDQARSGLVHFAHAGHPWPGQQWQLNPRDRHDTGLRTYASPPTGPAGDAMRPWNPCAEESAGQSRPTPINPRPREDAGSWTPARSPLPDSR